MCVLLRCGGRRRPDGGGPPQAGHADDRKVVVISAGGRPANEPDHFPSGSLTRPIRALMLPLSWTVSCTQRVTAKWVRMKPSVEPLEARAACSLAALHAAYLVDSANLARAQVGLPALTVNPGLAA